MDCSQVLPGAVNPGPCSIAAGYYYDSPFIVSRLDGVAKLWRLYEVAKSVFCDSRSKVM